MNELNDARKNVKATRLKLIEAKAQHVHAVEILNSIKARKQKLKAGANNNG